MADEETRESRDEVEDDLRRIEENPPEKLEDWPGGKAKYKTMGGPETDTGYDEGPTAKLGPSQLRYHEDGSVEVGGEKVDNPDDYKGDPIPGGPTDPNSSDDLGTVKSPRDQD